MAIWRFTASGALTIGRSINASANNLILSTGAASITFDNDPTLTAGAISLTQNGAFSATEPATLATTALTLENTSANVQGVHAWMVGGNHSLDLISGGNITVGIDIDLGVRFLNLAAQGAGNISFTGGARTIMAAIIGLESVNTITATTGDLTLISTRLGTISLFIGRSINAAANVLTLSTGAASIRFNNSPTLTAATISLTPGWRIWWWCIRTGDFDR